MENNIESDVLKLSDGLKVAFCNHFTTANF